MSVSLTRHHAGSILACLVVLPFMTAQGQAQVANQDVRTSTFLPVPTAPVQVQVLSPLVVTTSAPSSATTSAVSQPPPPPNSLFAFVSGASSYLAISTSTSLPPLTFPTPLPLGIARTASGKPIPCSPKNTKLNPSTHKLISECTEQMFCLAPPGSPPNATGLGMCFPRLCRRDDYPFGYGHYGGGNAPPKIRVKGKLVYNESAVVLPPMCGEGLFCPDNGSGCRAKVDVGGRCELGRDEQCAKPKATANIPDASNKAVCLNLTCKPATQTLNAPCTIENTTYVADIDRGAAGGGQSTSFIIKHDCISPSLFCDPSALSSNGGGPTCQKTKKLGQVCTFDAQCEMNYCATASGTCAVPPETPLHIAPWQWVATALFIIVAMSSIFLILAFIHRRHRYARYQDLQEYYHEQMSLRRSILALHSAAGDPYSPGKREKSRIE